VRLHLTDAALHMRLSVMWPMPLDVLRYSPKGVLREQLRLS
jgi:hypothetical protein